MITREKLLENYHYDPLTGMWTSKSSGRRIGWIIKGTGKRNVPYNRIHLFGKNYQSSRASWFYMTGSWPVFEIDHKNTDSLDDRWENLRPATRLQNEVNKGPYRNNRSGRKGVFVKSDGIIQSAIRRGGKRVHLGNFPTVEAAASAYAEAARAVDGEFLRIA